MERKVNMRSDVLVLGVEYPAVLHAVRIRSQPHMRNERRCGGRLSDGEVVWELAQYIAAASVLWAST